MSYGGRRGREQHKASYSFPILNRDTILQCLQELQIPCTLDDLEKPKPPFVRMVFENLAEHCMGVTKEEMNQPKFQGLDALQFPELHETSVPQITFFRTVAKLMNASQINDFTLKDVIKPDAKRLRRNISAVINFAKFREERLVAYTELTAKTDDLIDLRSQLEDEQDALKRRIEQLKAKKEEEQPEVDAMERECAELEAEINEKNKKQAILKYEAQQVKAECVNLRDSVQTIQFKTLNVQEDVSRLQGQIVKSPERLKRGLRDMEAALSRQREEQEELDARRESVAQRSKAAARAAKDVSKCVRVLEEIEKEATKLREVSTTAKARRAAISRLQAEAREVEAGSGILRRQLSSLGDKAKRAARNRGVQMEAAKQALEAARLEYDAVEQEYAETAAKIRENEARRRDATRALREDKTRLDAERDEMLFAYNHMRGAVERYHSELLADISAANVNAANAKRVADAAAKTPGKALRAAAAAAKAAVAKQAAMAKATSTMGGEDKEQVAPGATGGGLLAAAAAVAH